MYKERVAIFWSCLLASCSSRIKSLLVGLLADPIEVYKYTAVCVFPYEFEATVSVIKAPKVMGKLQFEVFSQYTQGSVAQNSCFALQNFSVFMLWSFLHGAHCRIVMYLFFDVFLFINVYPL